MSDEDVKVEEPTPQETTETPEAEPAPEPESTEEEAPKAEAGNSQWDAIAGDFQKLGSSLAAAVTAVLNDDSNKKVLNDLKEGTRKMADEVAVAVDQALGSEAVSQVKTESAKAAKEVKDAGAKVYYESKPTLAGVLRKVSEGLQSVIDTLEKPPAPKTETDPVDSAAPVEDADPISPTEVIPPEEKPDV